MTGKVCTTAGETKYSTLQKNTKEHLRNGYNIEFILQEFHILTRKS